MSDHMAALADHAGIPDPVRMAADCIDARPTTLLIANPEEAALPSMLLTQMDTRLLGCVSMADAADKLAQLVAVDAVVLRCQQPDAHLASLMPMLTEWIAQNDTTLIVSVGIDALDLAYFLLQSSDAMLLCDPSEMELATAIAFALRAAGGDAALQDIGRESDVARLQRLSQDASWLARKLADMPGAALNGAAAGQQDMLADRHNGYRAECAAEPAARPLTEGRVRTLIRARRLRARFLDGTLFADPAWDMLLDLLAARLGGHRVSVSSLCIAAEVPPTTALRWIGVLCEQGVVRREADPSDGRRVFIALSDDVAAALTQWFKEAEPLLCAALDPGRDQA